MILSDFVKGNAGFPFERKTYDYLFLLLMDLNCRIVKYGVMVDFDNANGVAGLDLGLCSDKCKDFLSFFYSYIDAGYDYAGVKLAMEMKLTEYLTSGNISDDDGICLCVMNYLLGLCIPFSAQTVLESSIKIADLSATFCRAEISNKCFEMLNEIRSVLL